MKANPVNAALELADVEPRPEFLQQLRAQLVSDVAAGTQTAVTAVVAATRPPRRAGVGWRPWTQPHRLRAIVIAPLVGLVVIGLAAVIGSRPDHRASGPDALHDVDAAKAQPLADTAVISHESVGASWREGPDSVSVAWTNMEAATVSQTPQCAQLSAFGLWSPTTKSVVSRQTFYSSSSVMFHAVWVFASDEDATKAMTAIAGDTFRDCMFAAFDRVTPSLMWAAARSSSRPWNPPAVPSHGDQQVILGQESSYVFPSKSFTTHFVNAYVRVGRAIAWVDPRYIESVDPMFPINRAIDATTVALQNVFGR